MSEAPKVAGQGGAQSRVGPSHCHRPRIIPAPGRRRHLAQCHTGPPPLPRGRPRLFLGSFPRRGAAATAPGRAVPAPEAAAPCRAGSRRRRLACPRAGLSSPRARSRRAGPHAQVAAAASSIRREPSRRLFCLTGWVGIFFLGFSGEPFLSHRGIGRGPTRQTQVDNASGLSCRCKWEGHHPMTTGPRELGPTRQ
jgi:hypothetical protein